MGWLVPDEQLEERRSPRENDNPLRAIVPKRASNVKYGGIGWCDASSMVPKSLARLRKRWG
jgi:hypothetical protein